MAHGLAWHDVSWERIAQANRRCRPARKYELACDMISHMRTTRGIDNMLMDGMPLMVLLSIRRARGCCNTRIRTGMRYAHANAKRITTVADDQTCTRSKRR